MTSIMLKMKSVQHGHATINMEKNTNQERKLKAFELASDVVKQFLTLAIAIVTITATLTEKYFASIFFYSKLMLMISWLAYLISVVCGLSALMKLTTEMEPGYGVQNISIKGGLCAKFALWQIITFSIALIFNVVFGLFGLFS